MYDDEIPKKEAIILDLSAESSELAITGSIRPGLIPKAIFDYLNPRKRVSFYMDSKIKNVSAATLSGDV